MAVKTLKSYPAPHSIFIHLSPNHGSGRARVGNGDRFSVSFVFSVLAAALGQPPRSDEAVANGHCALGVNGLALASDPPLASLICLVPHWNVVAALHSMRD